MVDGPVWSAGAARYEFEADSCSGSVSFQKGGFVQTGVVFGVPDAMIGVRVVNRGSDSMLVAPGKNPIVRVTRRGKTSVIEPESRKAVLEGLAFSLGYDHEIYRQFDKDLMAANTLEPGMSYTSSLAFNNKFPSDNREYEFILECPSDIVRFKLEPEP